MKAKHFYIINPIHLLIWCLIINSPILSQNPLDISSRITTQPVSPSNSTSTANVAPQKLNSNPFDVKKEPNRENSKPTPPIEIQRNVNSGDQVISRPLKIGILLASIIFFVLVRNMNLKAFSQIGQGFLSNLKLIEYKNSVNGLFNAQIGLFYLFFFINIAYFFYLCIEKNVITIPELGGSPFFMIFIFFVGVYMVKYIVLIIIEYALSIRRAIGHHLFSVSIHNVILGFLLFIVNSFFAFTGEGLSSIIFYLGIGLVVIFYLIRQVKGFQYLSEMRHFSFFHFFIYLCSCEISPLLLLAKSLTG